MKKHSSAKQDGAILFISLIILLLVTIVGISNVSLSTSNQRISFNYQTKNSTFQSSDSALKLAQTQLRTGGPTQTMAATPGGFINNSVTPYAGDDIQTETTTWQQGALKGSSLKQGSFTLFEYVTESNSSIPQQNTRTILREGFIQPSVGGSF